MRKSVRAGRVLTSVSVKENLYLDLGMVLRAKGRTYGEFWDDMIGHYLATKDIAKLPQLSTTEQEVCEALRRLIRKQDSLKVTLPPLLGISESTLRKFLEKD